jgi:uncharacterized protein YkwD
VGAAQIAALARGDGLGSLLGFVTAPSPKVAMSERRLPDRRMILGGLTASAAAAPTLASAAAQIVPAGWLTYEARLNARLADAGGGRFDAATARALLDATNTERRTAGAPACAWDDELEAAARSHAADLAARAYFSHVAPEGFDPSHRLAILARRRIGSASENIAYRRYSEPSTAAHLMGVWRSSPPHWTNLLKSSHRRAGYGVAVKGDRTYAVGLYGHVDGELPAPLPFRVTDEAALAAAVATAAPEIEGFELTDPLDERPLGGVSAAELPALAPGAYQLRPRFRINDRVVAVLWGPIFVKM